MVSSSTLSGLAEVTITKIIMNLGVWSESLLAAVRDRRIGLVGSLTEQLASNKKMTYEQPDIA